MASNSRSTSSRSSSTLASSSVQPTTNNGRNSNSNSKSAAAASSSSVPSSRHAVSVSPSPALPESATSPSPGVTRSHSHSHSHSRSHSRSRSQVHEHSYQHQHQHQQVNPGMAMSVPLPLASALSAPPSSTSPPIPALPIPGTTFYYHPYSLFPPPSHHGPPPPHPPAPPAPPRATRSNPSNPNAGNTSSNAVQDAQSRASPAVDVSPFLSYLPSRSVQQENDNASSNNQATSRPSRPSRPRGPSASSSTSPSIRGRGISSSASPVISSSASSSSVLSPLMVAASSSHSPATLHPSSSFHTSSVDSMHSRPQLIPTFAYYRSQTNYDKQHADGELEGNQAHHVDPMSAAALRGHSPATSALHDTGRDDSADANDATGDYDEDISAMAIHHPALPMRLHTNPSILPAAATLPPSSSSSNPPTNYLFSGEKRSNHEYYPSPHHQIQFRELMANSNSTHLHDPPISLNSLVDSEPGKKPAYPLPTIIRCAILGSPQERLTLSELYLAMERRFSYYTLGDGKSWRNSVRHNLSLNNLFEKVTRPITEPGKGCYWIVAHDKPPGNKRERKRNKKPGKKALAALEREKATAAVAQARGGSAAAAGTGTFSRQTDDEGEGEGDEAEEDEDDVDDQDQTITFNSAIAGTSARRKAATGSSTSLSSFPHNKTTAAATTRILPLLDTPTTTAIRPPFNPYSRGTVAPNEGSYAAVTGVMPILSAGYGIGPYGAASAANSVTAGLGAQTRTQTPTHIHSDGHLTPFSAYVAQSDNPTGIAPYGFQADPSDVGSSSSMWASSSGFAGLTTASTSSKRNPKPVPRQNQDSSIMPTMNMMSQHAVAVAGVGGRQNQDLGPMMMNLSQTPIQSQSQRHMNPSQESGALPDATMSFTQSTSIQSSQSSQRGRESSATSTPAPFTGSASASPAGLGRPQPLSTQSSFSSASGAFSIPESVASSGGENSTGVESSASAARSANGAGNQNQNQIGPHRTTRQNPTRRFDPVVVGPGLLSSAMTPGRPFSQPFGPPNHHHPPRDTFNTLAAQFASEFQTSSSTGPAVAPTSMSLEPATTAASATRSRKRLQAPSQSSLRTLLRSSKKQALRRGGNDESDNESQSEISEEVEEESEDENEDEFVPAGSARRKGRRK